MNRTPLRPVIGVRRGGSSHVDALDGLRGLAVALVFFVHFHPWVDPYLRSSTIRELSARIADTGNLGVDIFFVLSGYLIYGGLLRRPQPVGGFLKRRIQRLYPTFIVVFIPVLAIEVARGAPNLNAGAGPVVNLIGNITLLAGFVPVDPLIVVAWTLSWEIAFYIFTPLVFRYGRFSQRTARERLVIMGLGWAAVALPGMIRDFGNARLVMFLGGVAVAEWSHRQRPQRQPGPAGALGALAGAASLIACYCIAVSSPVGANALGVLEIERAPHDPVQLVRVGILLITLPLLLWSLVEGRTIINGLAVHTSLRWLGLVSYSYYLTHALVIRIIGEIAQKQWPPGEMANDLLLPLALVAAFLATLVVAWGSYVAVERPCSLDPEPAVQVLPPRIRRWPWQTSVTETP